VIDPGCQDHCDSFFQHILNNFKHFGVDISGTDAFRDNPSSTLVSGITRKAPVVSGKGL
jgi:hypothetical protein